MNLRESGGSGDQPLFRSAVDGGHVPTLRALNEGSVAQIPGVKVAQKGNLVGVVAPKEYDAIQAAVALRGAHGISRRCCRKTVT
jgi:hypothetical protein